MQHKPSCHAAPAKKATASCCDTQETGKSGADYFFWTGLTIISIAYIGFWLFGVESAGDHAAHVPGAGSVKGALNVFGGTVFELLNVMWIGVVIGILAMGFLSRVPRDFIMTVLGSGQGMRGILRATLAGVMLDLCNHGILMVGAKLYERGITAGQLMAFLIASPWNSLSLTFVLIALIGLKWTLAFIALSMLIGILTGAVFDRLVARGVLPANPNHAPVSEGFRFWPAAKKGLSEVKWTPAFFAETIRNGFLESRMILRWLFLGVIIAGVLRVVFTPDMFGTWFGPTFLGLGVTLLAATVIEVCSEGSSPIAADIINRAGAVGNGFTFLMAGAVTDYTEIMVLREATKSWKLALFLPLVTLPQVLLIGYLLNRFGGGG